MFAYISLKNNNKIKSQYWPSDAPRTRLSEGVPDGPTDGRTKPL